MNTPENAYRKLANLKVTGIHKCQHCETPTDNLAICLCSGFENNVVTEADVESVIYGAAHGIRPSLSIVLCEACRRVYTRKCESCGVNFIPQGKDAKKCGHCVSLERLTKCVKCGKEIGEEFIDIKYDINGAPCRVCLPCSKEYLKKAGVVRCGTCGAYVHSKFTKIIHSIRVSKRKHKKYTVANVCCTDCSITGTMKLRRCGICGKVFKQEDMIYVFRSKILKRAAQALGWEEGTQVCGVCEHNAKTECENCGAPMISLRNNCGECDGAQTFVREHGYTPEEFIMTGEFPWYGLEIETTGYIDERTQKLCSCEVHKGVGKNGDVIYQQHDGTINGHGKIGIEFCFHPRSIDEWFSPAGVSILKEFRDVVTKYGGHSYKTGTCGLHIHRSNDDIDTIDEFSGKTSRAGVVSLVASLVAIEPYIHILGQRTGVNVASYDGRPSKVGLYEVGDVYGSWKEVKAVFGEHGVSDLSLIEWFSHAKSNLKRITHKGAISVNTGHNTFEFRFFRGTTNVDTVLAHIAFAHLVTEWSASVNIQKIRKCNPTTAWEMFIKFLEESEQTPWVRHLISYAKSKRVM